jgi:hypothetical protein
LNTKTTIMTASVVVGAILVAGTLVLPYSYAMARHFGNFSFKSIDVRKSVDSIKQKVEAKPSAGSATGGSGGTANGRNSGASTGGNGGPANGGTTGAGGSGGNGGNADAHGGTTTV